MAETPNNGGVSCIFIDCDDFNATCTYSCFPSVEPLPLFPPPFPPPPPPPSSQSHLAPYLIAIVCVLGISFLLLTTCTIILRYRFTRSRRRQGVTPSNPDNSGVNNDHSFVDHPIWHITTVGLQQSVIDSITAFKYKKIDGFLADGSDSSCSVCLTEFEDGDDLRLLPKCSHAFHVSCIDTWLRSHKNCPLCRAPIVNEVLVGNSVVGNLNSTHSSFGVESQRVSVPLDDNNGGEGSSNQYREREDDLGRLPIFEGIKSAEILNRNRDLRIFSDLGQNNRFRGVNDDGLNSVSRSISFNAIAASAKSGAMMSNDGRSNEDCSCDGSYNEGCSRGGSSEGVLQQKNTNLKKEGNKRGSSMSGLLIKSSSIGHSLQKGPVSMKRSLSSSSRFFSFRRSKSQAAILPL